jgi:hypothetical protein
MFLVVKLVDSFGVIAEFTLHIVQLGFRTVELYLPVPGATVIFAEILGSVTECSSMQHSTHLFAGRL